jgi:hypothetical protein
MSQRARPGLREQRWRPVLVVVALVLAPVGVLIGASGRSAARPRRPAVLLVGAYRGHRGQFSSIQAAVDAAKPGDWILVAPGDYHEQADHRPYGGPQPADTPAGVVIAKPGIHLRGMNRNTVIVDGTLPGSSGPCSADPARQDLGPVGSYNGGKPLGRNGILVYKADNVTVENLTVCNFLSGSGYGGNEIWWNGGYGLSASYGQIGLAGFRGNYLSATTTYYHDPGTAAAYGIYSSRARHGSWDHVYSSNFNDSDLYVGACLQLCDVTIDHAHAQYGALGYSGTDAGGRLVIENSEFDHNVDGFDTNSDNSPTDGPSPQDGACPNGAISPITHTHSCWVFMANYVHDNNNPDVPLSASGAGSAPVGTGISFDGGRDDTIIDNRIENNGAWGIILTPFPDTESPPPRDVCRGGINAGPPTNVCLYDDWGNEVAGNTFVHNGWFRNDTNADIAEITETAGPTNCYHGNRDAAGTVTSSPSGLQSSKPRCDGHPSLPDPNPSFTDQILCDTQLVPVPCTPGSNYPRRAKVVMHPLPAGLPTMPDPCRGVPANPWCVSRACVRGPRLRITLDLPPGEGIMRVTYRGKRLRPRGQIVTIKLPEGRRGPFRVRLVERLRTPSGIVTRRVVLDYRRC